jgi:hypothetical protein
MPISNVKQRDMRGQILIEVMVALSIVVIAFSGVLGLLGTSLGLTRTISNQYVGTYLAAEGVEIVKNIIDENYFRGDRFGTRPFNQGISASRSYYLDKNSTSDNTGEYASNLQLRFDGAYYSYSAGENTPFRREIMIRQVDDNGDGSAEALEVTSRVTWSGKGGDFQAVVKDVFTRWWKT